MRTTVTLVMLVALSGCVHLPSDRSSVSIHLHDSPQNANGFAPGINPDTIRVVVGGRIISREEISIAKVTDPKKKADPGSPNDEFIVTLDPRILTLTSDKDVHLFCRDGAGNLFACRLMRTSDGSHEWEEMIGPDAENHYATYFDHLTKRRTYWQTTPEYELLGENGGLLLEDGKVVCGWGTDTWQLYVVTGSRLKELQNLGLQHVAKVECLIWGNVDNKDKTIDIRDWKIQRLYPKR